MQIGYLFKINKEKYQALVKLRSWEHPITALAQRTGFTKSMISQAINSGVAIGQDFMLAFIKVSGADPKNEKEWAGLFEIVKDDTPKPYQKDNLAKHDGKKPYKRIFGEISESGKIRVKDKAMNLDRLNVPVPIPAVDYYSDAMPKRYQVSNRFHK